MNQTETAVEKLKNDGIVLFPTETVFGVGCRITSDKAIRKLYKIKKREAGKPTSIVVKNIEQAQEYAIFTSEAKRLAERFWPGPLTLVLKAKKSVPASIQANGTIGLRQPSNGSLLKILEGVGEPILAPSANFAGEKPTAKLNSVDSRLRAMVDYVVDEKAGGEKPSTVLDLTNERPSLLREGPIESMQIEEVLGGSFG